MSVTLNDIYWTAGFLEGEAWFGLQNVAATPTISVVQVQKSPLEFLLSKFGGSLREIDGKGKRCNYWKWEIYSVKAAGLMMTLYTLMSDKRKEQIKKALIAWSKHKDPRRKLTWEQVVTIRKRYSNGESSVADLALEFSVSEQSMKSLVNGKSYKPIGRQRREP